LTNIYYIWYVTCTDQCEFLKGFSLLNNRIFQNHQSTLFYTEP
jgi:hypothetical protein